LNVLSDIREYRGSISSDKVKSAMRTMIGAISELETSNQNTMEYPPSEFLEINEVWKKKKVLSYRVFCMI